jgi:steroid delta-isomerase-like uncharacterized protein
MTMTPDEMDTVLEAHFTAEAKHDLEGILATLTDDVVHDAVGFPGGEVLRDHHEIATRYAQLFAAVEDATVEPVSRLYGDNFVVDECRYSGRTTMEFLGLPANQRVSFRLLHVCEFRDGRMSRENVWQGPPAVLEPSAE